jgi:hypothetical protein
MQQEEELTSFDRFFAAVKRLNRVFQRQDEGLMKRAVLEQATVQMYETEKEWRKWKKENPDRG